MSLVHGRVDAWSRQRLAGGALPLVVGRLPAPLRAPVAGIQAYAAAVAMAAEDPAGGAELDRVRIGLRRMAVGRWPGHPVLDRLVPAVRGYALPLEPLDRMLSTARTAPGECRTFDELLERCHQVGGPPGELALRVLGGVRAEQLALCRHVCVGTVLLGRVVTAATDWRTGRCLLPADELERFGVAGEDSTQGPVARRAGLLELQTERARALLDSGAPLASTLRGRRRLAVEAHLAYCRAVLAALERGRYRLPTRPEPTAAAVGRQWARSLLRHPG